MIRARIVAVIAAAAVALALAGATTAGASTLAVHADYLDNGVIDQPHSLADLRAALAAASGDAQYQGLATAIGNALDHELLGRSETGGVTASAGDGDALGVLPHPRTLDDTGMPPWPLRVLSVLAAMLVVAGAAGSVQRRRQSRR